MKDKDRDNQRRRELSRIRNGGIEMRGRKPKGGMVSRYMGLMQDDEWEFAQAMYEFQRVVRFPTWTEVLEVVKKLGYKKC